MAKKPAPPPAKSLTSSSSSEDEGEDSSSEEEQTNDTKPDPPPAKSLPSSSSSSEEEEDSSSDEEHANVTKPDPQSTIAKKYKFEESRDEEQEVPRPVSKTLSDQIATHSKPIPEKPNRKSPFTRLWSFDDEIRILRALVDYQSKHGLVKFSATGLKDFHQSVKESLSVDVGTAKLSDKIRRLQRKYTHANKKGENVKFLNSHDKSVYELSKKVWPEEEESDDVEVEALNVDSSRMTVNRRKRLKTDFPFIKDALAGNRLALQNLHKADAVKVAELEMKFEKNKYEELYLISEAYDVVCNEARKVMN